MLSSLTASQSKLVVEVEIQLADRHHLMRHSWEPFVEVTYCFLEGLMHCLHVVAVLTYVHADL